MVEKATLNNRLDGAHEWFLSGVLDAEQANQHRQNLALLAQSVPLLHQLKIALPKGAVAQWINEHPPAQTLAEPA